jgi:predicted aminopeptidase
MKIILSFCLLFVLGCARVGYLIDQGSGQFHLMSKGRQNKDVLKDPKVSAKIKSKIMLIGKYKEYFYNYWGRPVSGIYSETTFLDQDAVTYLVVASPIDRIKPKKECFPFMGCFPYIGFFSEKKAKEHAKGLEAENYETYIRPVYAYSTLGYFEDNILSSFFYYNDYDLAELVFHELFHTIFFIKGEVDLNENLANYFGKIMAEEYFQVSPEEKIEKAGQRSKKSHLSQEMVKLVKKLDQLLQEKNPKTKSASLDIKEEFFRSEFNPHLTKVCQDLELAKCSPLQKKWNNASLAGFLTYEKKGDQIVKLKEKLSFSTKEYFHFIENLYKSYKKGYKKTSFSDHLFAQ